MIPLLSTSATRKDLSASFFILHKMCADGMMLSCAHPKYLLMRRENIPGNWRGAVCPPQTGG